MSAAGGCIPLTRYALSKLRAMGPYGATVYLALLRLCPEYGTAFMVSHADLVALSGTSYQTLRKALGTLTDLELVTVTGKKVNGHDREGMSVTMLRSGCGLRCQNTCGKPVDSDSWPVDNRACDIIELEGAVTYEDTAIPLGLARASVKPQVNDGAVTSGDTAGGKPTPKGLEIEDLALGSKDLAPKKSHKAKAPARDPRVPAVFDAWVTFEFDGRHLTQHKGMTDQMEKAIVKALTILDRSHGKDASQDELVSAVRNYGRSLLDPASGWTYSWTLTEFCSRGNGFERFLDEAKPLERDIAAGRMRSDRAPVKSSSANGFSSARVGAFDDL